MPCELLDRGLWICSKPSARAALRICLVCSSTDRVRRRILRGGNGPVTGKVLGWICDECAGSDDGIRVVTRLLRARAESRSGASDGE